MNLNRLSVTQYGCRTWELARADSRSDLSLKQCGFVPLINQTMNFSHQTDEAGGMEKKWPGRAAVFATTHWSLVLTAGSQTSPEAAAALERLCEIYWYPLYAHVRRRGYSKEDAEDHTQAFFTHILERHSVQAVSPAKGKFRTFLLASLNYFLSDVRDRNMAQKRGGGCVIISFDAQAAEERYLLEPTDEQSPDKFFERRWALALLDHVLMRLKDEFDTAGKGKQFARLSGYVIENQSNGTYADAARDLGQTEEAVKKAVQRMRGRYGELFREEIANTVAALSDVDQELRYLCQLMSDNSTR
jgi:DNA-directed RNA polymerase specialized sigma24 family protein